VHGSHVNLSNVGGNAGHRERGLGRASENLQDERGERAASSVSAAKSAAGSAKLEPTEGPAANPSKLQQLES